MRLFRLFLSRVLRTSHASFACVTSSPLWCRKRAHDRQEIPTGRWSRMISPVELVLRLAVAAILGGLVGLERERLEWAAGMRTHALVSLGSALFPFHGGLHLRILRHPQRATRH